VRRGRTLLAYQARHRYGCLAGDDTAGLAGGFGDRKLRVAVDFEEPLVAAGLDCQAVRIAVLEPIARGRFGVADARLAVDALD